MAEFCEPQKRHIVSVFKIIQELLAPSSRKGKNQFQQLMELLPNDHKAKWFAGAALNTAEQSMASVMSTALSRLNSFLDSELEQLLCFDTEIDAEKFCNEKSAAENAEMYIELLPFAKECGVKIATENMWNWDTEKDQSSFAACATAESFIEHLDAVKDDYLVACLDIGHAEMRGSGSGTATMIYALKDRLQALHIHDNDKWHDSHQIPFSMSIDFNSVVKALKDINYQGYLTLEADSYLKKYSVDNIFEGIKNLAAADKRLSDMFGVE